VNGSEQGFGFAATLSVHSARHGKEGLNAAVRSVPGVFQKKESAQEAVGGTFHLLPQDRWAQNA
jgi:hypothetical protein